MAAKRDALGIEELLAQAGWMRDLARRMVRDEEAADEILQWCGRELERGFRARRFSAVRTARVFTWCDAPALPGARLEPAEVVSRFGDEQGADGGFGEASDDRAARTWDAWIALERLQAGL